MERKMAPYVEIQVGDVLLGRSKTAFRHNAHFHLLIAEHSKAYLSGNRAQKTHLVQLLTHFIQGRGGRFLKRDEDSGKWYPVSNREAKEKVGHALRDSSSNKTKCFGQVLERSTVISNLVALSQQQNNQIPSFFGGNWLWENYIGGGFSSSQHRQGMVYEQQPQHHQQKQQQQQQQQQQKPTAKLRSLDYVLEQALTLDNEPFSSEMALTSSAPDDYYNSDELEDLRSLASREIISDLEEEEVLWLGENNEAEFNLIGHSNFSVMEPFCDQYDGI